MALHPIPSRSRSMILGASALLALGLMAPGCIIDVFGHTDSSSDGDSGDLRVGDMPDGGLCLSAAECRSGRCEYHECLGSGCASDPCEDGWECVHTDPDWLSSAFGGDGSDICVPTCGECGNAYHCEDGRTTGTCTEGPTPPTADAGGPYVAPIDTSVEVTATASSPTGAITTYAWTFDDDTTASGAVVEHTFSTIGQHYVELTVTDTIGATAATSTIVDVCGTTGTACDTYFGGCCEGFACDVSSALCAPL